MNRLKTVLFLGLMTVGMMGCRPSFEEASCTQDSDCFQDEYCAPVRLCTLRTSRSLVIASFKPSSPIIDQGDGVTLSWETRGGKRALITGPDAFSYEVPSASVTQGSVDLKDLKPGNLTYTMTLSFDDLEKTETVDIEVKPKEIVLPVIDRFDSDTQIIDPGARVTLSWAIEGATSATISGGAAPFTIPVAELKSGSRDVNPTQTLTYTLTAINDDGSVEATRMITVVPLPDPLITSFAATPLSIIPGESIELSWEVMNATSISIIDAESDEVFGSQDLAVVGSGSVDVTPTESTTYTLTALSPQGSVQSTPIDVIVITPPVINAFTASQTADVTPGAMVDLDWDVTGADSVEIRDQDDTLITSSTDATGSFAATIDENTTFTLTATNAAGEELAEVTVTLLGSPVINTFTASKQTGVIFNEMIDLSWDVTDADGIEIRDSNNALITSSAASTGSFSVAITANRVYTLTASNASGSVSASVTVTLLTPPTITSFSASQTMNVAPGAMVSLSWNVTNADSIEIKDQSGALITSSVMLTGSFSVTPSTTTTYSLNAINAAGSVSDIVTVNVTLPSTISSFMADVTSTISGEAVMLSWMTSDTTTLTLTDNQGGAPIVIAPGDRASGTLRVRPQVSTIYTLTAQNMAAAPVTQDVTITVGAAPLLITEVLFAPPMMAAGRQWVEIYNPGSTFVQLSHYSLGWGGASFAAHTKAFAPYLLAPKESHVVGMVSDASNFAPVIDFSSSFTPILGNGSVAAEGVALFFLKAADVLATSVPIDAIIWGGPNTSMLPNESGMTKTEISPAPVGTSLVRGSSSSDVFLDSGAGYPNVPMFVSAITPVSGPNTATDTLIIQGYGFDVLLDTFTLGSSPLSCAGDLHMVMCQLLAPSTDMGLVDLTISRTQSYVPDAQGAPVLAPASTVYSYVSRDVFFLMARELDPGASFECATQAPVLSTALAGDAIVVDVLLFAQGFTEGAAGMLPPGWVLQAAIIDPTTPPFESFAPAWTTWVMGLDAQGDDLVNSDNEIFSLPLSSSSPRVAQAAFRVSRDAGTTWIYCNAESAGGSDSGWVQGVDVSWN